MGGGGGRVWRRCSLAFLGWRRSFQIRPGRHGRLGDGMGGSIKPNTKLSRGLVREANFFSGLSSRVSIICHSDNHSPPFTSHVT